MAPDFLLWCGHTTQGPPEKEEKNREKKENRKKRGEKKRAAHPCGCSLGGLDQRDHALRVRAGLPLRSLPALQVRERLRCLAPKRSLGMGGALGFFSNGVGVFLKGDQKEPRPPCYKNPPV